MKSARQLVDALRIEQPPNKSLGQHFLIDDDILERIIHMLILMRVTMFSNYFAWNIDSSFDAKLWQVTAIEFDEGACKHLDYEFRAVNEGKLDLISEMH